MMLLQRRVPRHALVPSAWLTLPILSLTIATPATHAATPCGSWSFVATPTLQSGASHLTAAAALSTSDAWAVGSTADGAGTRTLHWDGSAWSVVPAPNPSTMQPLNLLLGVAAIASSDVWAVGLFNPSSGAAQSLAIHWDGSSWSLVPSPNLVGGSSFAAVSALSSDDMWAVGSRAPESPSPAAEVPLAAHWDGSSWTPVAAPFVGNRINRLQGVSARTSSDVWAVGVWKNTTSSLHILIQHWDGSAWSLSSAPDPGINDQLLGIATVAADDAWAVGERIDVVDGSQPLIMHWDGSAWSTVVLPVFPGEFNRLNAIRAAAPDDIWAAGAVAAVAGGPPDPLIMHFDGTGWSTVPAGPSDGSSESFGGLALAPGCDAWAVGSYDLAGSTSPLTERLQPQQPSAVPDDGRDTAGRGAFLALAVAPNPAYGEARVSMVLTRGALLRVDVFDVRGRRVRRLEERTAPAGPVIVSWDGRDDGGAASAPGLYFVRVAAGGEGRTARFVLRR